VDHAIPHSEFLSWDEEDRDKVLAYLIEEGDRCQTCGTKDSEWAKDRYAYVPETHLCMGCYLQAAATDALRDSNGKTMDGTTVRLVLNTPEKQAEQAERARRIREGLDREE
jgi:hypothetical protein